MVGAPRGMAEVADTRQCGLAPQTAPPKRSGSRSPPVQLRDCLAQQQYSRMIVFIVSSDIWLYRLMTLDTFRCSQNTWLYGNPSPCRADRSLQGRTWGQ